MPPNLWEPVRKGVLRWLETGARPDIPVAPAHQAIQAKGNRRKGGPSRPLSSPQNNWPLPDTGLRRARTGNVYASWPKTRVLIQIAILKKRNDDALAWYARVPKRDAYGWGYGYGGGLGGVVAEAVKETHPDAALDIWREMSEGEIVRVNPAAYDVAGAYLEKMKKVYARLSRRKSGRG